MTAAFKNSISLDSSVESQISKINDELEDQVLS